MDKQTKGQQCNAVDTHYRRRYLRLTMNMLARRRIHCGLENPLAGLAAIHLQAEQASP
jgi:hypothetical protein